MGTISFAGLATGLDTEALVTGLMGVEKLPLNRLQAKQVTVTAAQSALAAFSAKISALATQAEELADRVTFQSLTASSSAPAVVATVTGQGSAGSFSVQVEQLAKEQRTRATSQLSQTAALGFAGTLKVQVGSSAAIDLTIEATDSLASIAAKLNDSGARLSASIVYDGGTGYSLLVRGLDTGAGNAISFTETGFSLGLSTPANTYQTAQDSRIVIDGVVTVTRSSNLVTDALAGVSLALTAPTTDPVTVTVAEDTGALVGKIGKLISAYNAIVTAGHSTAGFGATKASNSYLAGDGTIRLALDALGSLVAGPLDGVTSRYDQLAEVGLHLARDGQLTLDVTQLKDALATDPSAVEKLFLGDAASGTAGALATMKSKAEGLVEGSSSLVKARIDSLGRLVENLEGTETRLQLRLDAYEARLRKQFTNLEVLMSSIQTQGAALSGFTGLSTSSSSSSSG